MIASKRSSCSSPLADLPLRAAAEQHAVRHHDAEPARGVQHRHHVLDEREVALRLRRHAEPEARMAVVLGHVAAPLVEAERRVGDHPVVEQQLTLVHELRVPDRVALFDPGVGQAVEQHVHLADGPRAEVLLLPVERQVARVAALPLDVVGALDQHAAGAGGRVADAHPFGGRQQIDDELDDHPRGVELPALLARVVGELLDQVLVGAAEQVGLGHSVVAERDLREMLDQAREHRVAVPRVAELAFVVVVDAGENALQRAVLLLQRRARLVQRLADVGGRPLDSAPTRPVRHEELVLVRIGPRHRLGHTLGDELLRFFLEAIRQPLQEEQGRRCRSCSRCCRSTRAGCPPPTRGTARAGRRSVPPRTGSIRPRLIETAPTARLRRSSLLRSAPEGVQSDRPSFVRNHPGRTRGTAPSGDPGRDLRESHPTGYCAIPASASTSCALTRRSATSSS